MSSLALARVLMREQGLALSAVGLLLALCLGIWGWLVGYQQRQHAQLLLGWNERRQQIHGLGQQRGGSTDNQNRALLQRLFATVPGYNEFPRVLGQLTDIASLQGASITAISYRLLPPAAPGLNCYRLSITCSGDYGALKAFLAQLQRLHPLAYVESISMEHREKAGTRIDSSITMQLTFRQERVPS